MPVYGYVCKLCKIIAEELYFDPDDAPQTAKCLCGGMMQRSNIHRFRHVGPVFHDLMQVEKQLLGAKGLKEGKRLRGKRDIENWERANGLVRTTARQQRVNDEYANEMVYEQGKIVNSEGKDGWFEHVNRGDIKRITGWSESQYVRWRNLNNAEESRIGTDGSGLGKDDPGGTDSAA